MIFIFNCLILLGLFPELFHLAQISLEEHWLCMFISFVHYFAYLFIIFILLIIFSICKRQEGMQVFVLINISIRNFKWLSNNCVLVCFHPVFLEIEGVQNYKVYCHYLGYRGIHQSKRLKIYQRVFVHCSGTCSLVTATSSITSLCAQLCSLRALICSFIKVGNVG